MSMQKLIDALIKAQAKFKPFTKTKTAQAGKFSYKYADYSDVLESVSDALRENGLAIIHTTEVDDCNGYFFKSTLFHITGENISTVKKIPEKLSPQEMGSFETYMKRYNTCGLLSISSEEDEDGQTATKPQNQPQNNYQQKPQAQQTQVSPFITPPQITRLYSLATNNGWSTEDIKNEIMGLYNIDSTSKILKKDYNDFCKLIMSLKKNEQNYDPNFDKVHTQGDQHV